MTAALALVDRLRALPAPARADILAGLTGRQKAALRWAWRSFWARPDVRAAERPSEGWGQLPPDGEWSWWASIGGRGSGKTRSCAEWVTEEAGRLGKGAIFHLVGATVDDAQATMIEGPSGLLAVTPPWLSLDYRSSKQGGLLVWSNGARGRVFGADKPTKGRGPQCNRMWLDDPAAFGPHGMQVLEQLLYGFRIAAPDGSQPRGVISSTPIDSELLGWIMAGTAEAGRRRKSKIVYSRSATDDNRGNLTENFFNETLAEFAGTELEQQERYGIYDATSAKKVMAGIAFDVAPVRVTTVPPRFLEVAIWVDPALSTSARACEVGMTAGGMTSDGHIWGLEDLSDHMNSTEWPETLLDAVERWRAVTGTVRVGVETNRSGDKDEALIRGAEKLRRLLAGLPGVSILDVRTVFTQTGKAMRATPLPRLYKAGVVHHPATGWSEVEKQLRALDDTPAPNRDRADAWVYTVLDLVGALDVTRVGSAVGGVQMGVETYGRPAAGAVAVGPSVPAAGPAVSFAFGGTPGRW